MKKDLLKISRKLYWSRLVLIDNTDKDSVYQQLTTEEALLFDDFTKLFIENKSKEINEYDPEKNSEKYELVKLLSEKLDEIFLKLKIYKFEIKKRVEEISDLLDDLRFVKKLNINVEHTVAEENLIEEMNGYDELTFDTDNLEKFVRFLRKNRFEILRLHGKFMTLFRKNEGTHFEILI